MLRKTSLHIENCINDCFRTVKILFIYLHKICVYKKRRAIFVKRRCNRYIYIILFLKDFYYVCCFCCLALCKYCILLDCKLTYSFVIV